MEFIGLFQLVSFFSLLLFFYAIELASTFQPLKIISTGHLFPLCPFQLNQFHPYSLASKKQVHRIF